MLSTVIIGTVLAIIERKFYENQKFFTFFQTICTVNVSYNRKEQDGV